MTTSNPTQEDGIKSTVVGIKDGKNGGIVEFDRQKIRRLQMTYNQAAAEAANTFEFEGYTYVTNYAKYLLEYLDGRLE